MEFDELSRTSCLATVCVAMRTAFARNFNDKDALKESMKIKDKNMTLKADFILINYIDH
jgi:hypothetical protein